ncbi:uncharacterized protein LOC135610451 isoform X2 [Musa acuminata AAA Group]|uniref:uncharacterized protein LOC103975712 isoform X2 n=1 Tax=Musa acuminata AAA Group TaxID=214697 RepID=UPI0031DF03A8
MGALGELEALQTCLLQRITAVELSLQTHSLHISSDCVADGEGGETTEARLSAILRARGVDDFAFKRVPADYYDRPIEVRRDILGAPSVEHLCKSIVLYAARLNAENIKNFLYTLNNSKISKKKFNMRLAPEEESLKLTGFVHNAVTCIGMETDIPVILDEAITKLKPNFFWLGGGEVDLKLRIRTSQFISAVNPFVVNCSS